MQILGIANDTNKLVEIWNGYFVVKTAMPPQFLAKKLPQGRKAGRKTAANYALTKRHRMLVEIWLTEEFFFVEIVQVFHKQTKFFVLHS